MNKLMTFTSMLGITTMYFAVMLSISYYFDILNNHRVLGIVLITTYLVGAGIIMSLVARIKKLEAIVMPDKK